MKAKFAMWAMRRELMRHSGEIRAEMDRLKAIRTLAELKVWGREKGGALGALVQSHGPQFFQLLKTELARKVRGKGSKE